MSNPETPKNEPVEKERELSMSDMDILLGIEQEMAKQEAAKKLAAAQTKPAFQPKTPRPINASNTARENAVAAAIADEELKAIQQGPDPDANLNARIASMEAELKSLREGRGGVKVTQATGNLVDFSRVTEHDVYDLSVPIEAIVHEVPDASLIKLKDPSYVARWVSLHPQIMGKRRAAGFTPITREDLADDLGMTLELDENGFYKYIDVVAMKCPKAKYYGALRTNHLRALAVVDRKNAQKVGQAKAESELMKGFAEDDPSKTSYGRDYQHYKSQGKMEVYTPGV